MRFLKILSFLTLVLLLTNCSHEGTEEDTQKDSRDSINVTPEITDEGSDEDTEWSLEPEAGGFPIEFKLSGNAEEDIKNTSITLNKHYNNGPAIGAGSIDGLIGKTVLLWNESKDQVIGNHIDDITFDIVKVELGSRKDVASVTLYSSADLKNYRNFPFITISNSSGLANKPETMTINYYSKFNAVPEKYYNSALFSTVQAIIDKQSISDDVTEM